MNSDYRVEPIKCPNCGVSMVEYIVLPNYGCFSCGRCYYLRISDGKLIPELENKDCRRVLAEAEESGFKSGK